MMRYIYSLVKLNLTFSRDQHDPVYGFAQSQSISRAR